MDLAVSMSTMTSLTLTVSPTATRQVTISASVSPSPTSGNLNSLMQQLLERAGVVDGVEDAVDPRQEVVLDTAGRVGSVVTGDALHGRLEGGEALLGDPCGDLGAEAERARRLVHDDRVAGAAHGLVHRGQVERRQGAQVDDLEVDAVLARGRCGLEAGGDHGAVGDERGVGA